MIGSRRFIRTGFVFSMVAHGGLLLGLLFVGSGGVRSTPPEAITVEIVPSVEAQSETRQVEGTPFNSTLLGSEMSSNSEKGSASTAPPRPKTAAPSLQQTQAQLIPQHSGSLAAQPQTEPPVPEEMQSQFELLLPTATKDSANRPNASEMFAMPLALPGGRVGGRFDVPTSNPAMLPHGERAAFRARLNSCSQVPAGIDEKVASVVRISFKRDGTLASRPQLRDASLSPDAAVLMHTAVSALQRCQPFNELPADKYKNWKTIDLVVTPLVLSGG